MCEHGDTVLVTVKGIPRDVDRCIAPIVEALNQAGTTTAASCCGHGHRPGTVALEDGREIIIAPDYGTARRINDEMCATDIHGELSRVKLCYLCPMCSARGEFKAVIEDWYHGSITHACPGCEHQMVQINDDFTVAHDPYNATLLAEMNA